MRSWWCVGSCKYGTWELDLVGGWGGGSKKNNMLLLSRLIVVGSSAEVDGRGLGIYSGLMSLRRDIHGVL